jgi:hypothetical protein
LEEKADAIVCQRVFDEFAVGQHQLHQDDDVADALDDVFDGDLGDIVDIDTGHKNSLVADNMIQPQWLHFV